MANSRFSMETKAITEGALMAALAVLMAMAGIYIPVLEPLLVVVWALPVVVVCLRRGMLAGIVTMAVASIVIVLLSIQIYAVEMLFRSALPALLLGYGFLRKWKSETTIFVTTIAAFIGFAIAIAITIQFMGVSIEELFMLQPEMVDAVTDLFMDYMFSGTQGISAEEVRKIVADSFAMTRYLLPAIVLIVSLLSSLTNYIAANFILGKLKIQLPPITRVDAFRMPLGVIFVFILGYGMEVASRVFWPDTPFLLEMGQNLTLIMLAVYFFQGMGLVLYIIRMAPQGTRVFGKILLFLIIIWTHVFFLRGVAYVGVADALFDFRRMGTWLGSQIHGNADKNK